MKKEAILYENWIKPWWLKCTACHNYCQIPEWATWICWIRLNDNWKLYLLTWWKALWINIDPIEKKPLFNMIPGWEAFSFGTAGCNFHCLFCQNWQMSQIKQVKNEIQKREDNFLYVSDLENLWTTLLPTEIIEICKDRKIESIAYTYNEPTVFVEYAYDTMILTRPKEEAERIKNANKKEWEIFFPILNVFVSNWYESNELLDLVEGYLDVINIDLKWFSEDFYGKVIWGKLEQVKNNIKKIWESKHIFLEITTLVIPGENDSEEELRNIAKFIKSISSDIPWHISWFYPAWKMLDKPYTPVDTLIKAYEIWLEEGLRYVYVGNVSLSWYETTYCPKCKEPLIQRSWVVGQNVEDLCLEEGTCPNCWTKIPGIWRKKDIGYIVRKETIF